MVLLSALLLSAGIVWTLFAPIRGGGGLKSNSVAGSRKPRDVYAGAAYANAKPGVAYVGDEACVRCHREISEDYRTHPMGRSLARIQAVRGSPPTGSGD